MNLFAILLLLSRTAYSQTGCGGQYTNPGVYICYPNPSENAADVRVPDIFHLSAQGNASAGGTIQRYTVLLDGRVIYENRLATSTPQLSIEINLKSPFSSGTHTLRVMVDGTGEAQVTGLRFYTPATVGFCDPVSSFEVRTCQASNIRGPLQWSVKAGGPRPFGDYIDYLELYRRNLTSLEADIADAVAVDSHGNLYMAFHSSADVELRKYAPDGSIKYDARVRACGGGYLAVAGLAVDDAGSAWIVGNTNACLPVTRNALQKHVANATEMHGFVLLLDTSNPSSTEPRYLTYLAGVENRISAVRVDESGNAYVAGMSASMEYPHNAVLTAVDGPATAHRAGIGFVSVLNASGSGLLWSTVLPQIQLTAITQDGAGNVFVTGRVASSRPPPQSGMTRTRATQRRQSCGGPGLSCDDAFVAEISDDGRRLSYFARLGASGIEEGRAISMTTNREWILVSGETNSPDFPTTSAIHRSRDKESQPFIVALQPCRTGLMYASRLIGSGVVEGPEIATAPALDAFATASRPAFSGRALTDRIGPLATIQIAPACQVAGQ
jgi:hypothetical protein